MNQDFEKFIETAQKISLGTEDRRQIRKDMLAFMQANPVRNAGLGRQGIQQRSGLSLLLIKFTKPMPIALIVLLLLGGGVSAAAENSLPGDMLHPIKVEINEKVRAALALSASSKANWEVRLAERRLEEAEELSAKTGTEIKTDVMARIEANFDHHADRVKDRIAKFGVEGKTELAANLSSKFEASLRAHDEILERLRAKFEDGDVTKDEVTEEVKKEFRNLREEVKERREAIKEVRKEHEDKVIRGTDAQAAAEAAAKMSANVIAESKRFITSAEAKFGAEAVVDAKTKLAEAERAHAEAQAKLEAGSFREAFLAFHESARIAQHAKLLVRAHAELRIDVQRETDDSDKDDDTDANEVEVKTRGRLELKLNN